MDWSEIFGITVSVVVILLLFLDSQGPRGRAKLYERVGFIFCRCPQYVVERAATLFRKCVESVVECAKAWWRQRQWLQQLQQLQQRRRERHEHATGLERDGEESGIDGTHVASGVRLPLDRPPTYHSDLPPPQYDGGGSVDTLPGYYDDDDEEEVVEEDEEEVVEEDEEESEAESDRANWARIPGRRASDETSSMIMEMTGDLADGHTQMRRE
ncbi:hypothetical protein IWX90DRAFT_487375 [Phyllosticta citrichinensis]|uniref:Uncharacterized protein n=1 Tax=Phyllosticta citrichinensis TaxID=1130410 RepID=A0ABR1XQX7_9PEZI